MYILTANYAFGHSLEEMTSDVVKAAQGRVLGTLRYPFPDTTDFSSYSATGAGFWREGARPRQRRAGYGQLHQASA